MPICSRGLPKPRLFYVCLCVHVSPTIMGSVCLFCVFLLKNNLAAMEAARTLVAAIRQRRIIRESTPMAILRSRGPQAHLVRAQRRGEKCSYNSLYMCYAHAIFPVSHICVCASQLPSTHGAVIHFQCGNYIFP